MRIGNVLKCDGCGKEAVYDGALPAGWTYWGAEEPRERDLVPPEKRVHVCSEDCQRRCPDGKPYIERQGK